MNTTISADYSLILGKLSLDVSFAQKFFENFMEAVAGYDLTEHELDQLRSLDKDKFQYYMENILMKSCDCDSCCNGGEGSGNCSECFSSCCQ